MVFREWSPKSLQLVLHCVLWYKQLNVILSRMEYVISTQNGTSIFDCMIL